MNNMSWKHTAWAIVFAAIILLILAALPVQAQELGGATSSTLYLPSIEYHFVMWFTDDELTTAMRRDGYDVEQASMHTVCTLDVTAVPPYLLRYSSCEQYWVDGVATEGTGHYILWQKLGDGFMHSTEVGQ